MRTPTVLAAAVLASSLIASSASATLIAYDPILAAAAPTSAQAAAGVYKIGNAISNQPGNVVAGFSNVGGWTSGAGTSNNLATGTSLTYPSLATDGGAINWLGYKNDNLYRSNARTFSSYTKVNTYYASALLNRDSIDSANPLGSTSYALLGLGNAAAPPYDAGTTGTSAPKGFYWGFAGANSDLVIRAKDGTGTLADTALVSAATQGTTYFVIIKANVNDGAATTDGGVADSITYWVNPTDFSSESAATSTALATGTISTDAFSTNADIARATVLEKNWAGPVYYDELRFGTTFTDVVPEPASLSLLALGALPLLRRRRA